MVHFVRKINPNQISIFFELVLHWFGNFCFRLHNITICLADLKKTKKRKMLWIKFVPTNVPCLHPKAYLMPIKIIISTVLGFFFHFCIFPSEDTGVWWINTSVRYWLNQINFFFFVSIDSEARRFFFNVTVKPIQKQQNLFFSNRSITSFWSYFILASMFGNLKRISYLGNKDPFFWFPNLVEFRESLNSLTKLWIRSKDGILWLHSKY